MESRGNCGLRIADCLWAIQFMLSKIQKQSAECGLGHEPRLGNGVGHATALFAVDPNLFGIRVIASRCGIGQQCWHKDGAANSLSCPESAIRNPQSAIASDRPKSATAGLEPRFRS